ncbi:MAG: glycosyltransferase family 4 protein [Oscillospiraceae bacterium]
MEIELNTLLDVVLALGVALVVCFVTTPLARAFARKVGAVDIPKDGRRMHDHPIPRLGGLAIFLGFLISVVLFAEIDRQVQGMLLGSIIIITIGAIDDIIPLPAWLKFIFQIAAAAVAVIFGIRIEMISNPIFWSSTEYINFGVWSVPITIIWIVGITNSVNLIDGLDGLAVGVSAISSMSVLVISLVLGQYNIAIILAALVGACIGFMPYNLNPARIFMGDTGALLLGYVLATVSVMGLLKFYAIISFAVPLLALGLPIFDTLFAIVRRLLKGQNPMSPDRGHFHHRLIDMGLSQKQAVAILYSISAVLGLSAVLITTSGEMKAMMLIFAFCVAITIGVVLIKSMDRTRENHLERQEHEEKKASPHDADAPAEERPDPGNEPENESDEEKH